MQVPLPLIIPEGVMEALGLLFDLFDNSSWVARSGTFITSAVLHQTSLIMLKPSKPHAGFQWMILFYPLFAASAWRLVLLMGMAKYSQV